MPPHPGMMFRALGDVAGRSREASARRRSAARRQGALGVREEGGRHEGRRRTLHRGAESRAHAPAPTQPRLSEEPSAMSVERSAPSTD